MPKFLARLSWATVLALIVFAAAAYPQTFNYRQTNLSSDLTTPGFANNINPVLRNPSGLSFAPGLGFLVPASTGRVLILSANGASTGPLAFGVPSPSQAAPASRSAAIGDPKSFFAGGVDPLSPFAIDAIAASSDGGIYVWGIFPDGSFPSQATLVVDHSGAGAVYTSLAILKPDCCAPILAVANFHTGKIETFDTHFAPTGSFIDTHLPPGFAPYALQVIGNQLFVASALQDGAAHDPVPGVGNGIISVFDLQANFIRRFFAGDALNIPAAMAQAPANFGPLSNDILIGNAGDGVINAFDPTTGGFISTLNNGDFNPVVNSGLSGLIFGSDDAGDANTLYLTAAINSGLHGLFASLTVGHVSQISVSSPSFATDTPTHVDVIVFPSIGDTGNPSGTVVFQDQDDPTATATQRLTFSVAGFDLTLHGIGHHTLLFSYSGDDTFLPSTSQKLVQVNGILSAVTLTAPANATPGADVLLTAVVTSAGGIPTGQVAFHDGNASIGTATLDGTGTAVLHISTLAAGAHTLTAIYAGDTRFSGSVSTAATVTIGAADFSIAASPTSATVTAGQSTQFTLTVTPSGGFASAVTFSCPQITGITCAFNPPSVTPANGAATTTLTVSTSASVTHFGRAPVGPVNPLGLIRPNTIPLLAAFALALAGIPLLSSRRRKPLLASFAMLALLCVAFAGTGCGATGATISPNKGTAVITVTAQSGTLSHTTTVSVTVQ